MIYPTAIIHPLAKIGANVRIGPYAVLTRTWNSARTVWSDRTFI